MMQTIKTPLEEGNYYPFQIIGTILLPDSTEQYLLKDPNGIKHLLPAEPYYKFGFRNNQTINCHIDKINCTGKIYIEPEHPVYSTGGSYNFLLKKFSLLTDENGNEQEVAVFKDVFENLVYLQKNEIPKGLKPGEELECKVEKIKKGKVYISYNEYSEDYSDMKAGETYNLKLIDEIRLSNKYDYYLFRNETGKTFRIRKKFYDLYGFNKGENIQCKLLREGDHFRFEPEHPKYVVGKKYPFEILSNEWIVEYPQKRIEVYYLRNEYGKEIVLKKTEVNPDQIKDGFVECLVTGIRRSRILVQCQ